ncbi:MAG: hypothetical protein FJ276_16670 [Planctomycetes bacterium]|nr:hypothetical protein [Planctomycetota bacterium]
MNEPPRRLDRFDAVARWIILVLGAIALLCVLALFTNLRTYRSIGSPGGDENLYLMEMLDAYTSRTEFVIGLFGYLVTVVVALVAVFGLRRLAELDDLLKRRDEKQDKVLHDFREALQRDVDCLRSDVQSIKADWSHIRSQWDDYKSKFDHVEVLSGQIAAERSRIGQQEALLRVMAHILLVEKPTLVTSLISLETELPDWDNRKEEGGRYVPNFLCRHLLFWIEQIASKDARVAASLPSELVQWAQRIRAEHPAELFEIDEDETLRVLASAILLGRARFLQQKLGLEVETATRKSLRIEILNLLDLAADQLERAKNLNPGNLAVSALLYEVAYARHHLGHGRIPAVEERLQHSLRILEGMRETLVMAPEDIERFLNTYLQQRVKNIWKGHSGEDFV